MIRFYDLNNISIEEILLRDAKDAPNVEEAVRKIMQDVAVRGDEALLDYTEKFDSVRPKNLLVSEEETQRAFDRIDPALLRSLEGAAQRIVAFHRKQAERDFIITEPDGAVTGQRVLPIGKAGLYVPGGTACYPSSVLMNAIPARIAGVEEIVMTTPPQRDGSIPDQILVAAKTAGVTKLVKAGGAQAVAALAYGTQSVPRVHKITGPGNLYVATAKRLASQTVAIDMVAGPSEILVIADGGANPVHVAADLLSQAEHDPMATAVLVTDSKALAQRVAAELERQMELLPRRAICERSVAQNGKIILAGSLDEALDAANAIAPEHLELAVADPFALLGKVKNAGSVFLGYNTPEAVGDYYAGCNHVLPTGGTARFSSPLSVGDFVKRSQFIYYSREALRGARGPIECLARAEGLQAHGRSVSVRFEEEGT